MQKALSQTSLQQQTGCPFRWVRRCCWRQRLIESLRLIVCRIASLALYTWMLLDGSGLDTFRLIWRQCKMRHSSSIPLRYWKVLSHSIHSRNRSLPHVVILNNAVATWRGVGSSRRNKITQRCPQWSHGVSKSISSMPFTMSWLVEAGIWKRCIRSTHLCKTVGH